MISRQLTINDAEHMMNLGEVLSYELRDGDRINLIGELGAGKTTLAKGIVRGLGYPGRVTSPTFTIMNVYQGRLPIYHLDFYRLRGENIDPDEWEEAYYGDGITLVEWPEDKVEDDQNIRIEIEITSGDYDLPRMVTIFIPDERRTIIERLTTIAGT
ncbi:MAG: tRNA (adenosine(37)-N6)-threonylcarbamoyltransferase complex ATPase subunit type 1 TsaE [Chitinophagales bacterium]